MVQRIKTKEDLKRFLDYEVQPISLFLRICPIMISERQLCRKHQILLRKTEFYMNSGRKFQSFFYRRCLQRFQCIYGMHIPPNVFDIGLKIIHSGPILVNSNVVAGKNCTLHVGAKIVAGGTDNGVPVIGDNVIFGVGAVALGEITIADGVAIGANAVVNRSVLEPNIAVAGIPARKISSNGSNVWGKRKAPQEE